MTERPNLLFFHIENSSTGDWGCYGERITIGAETLNVDRFAADGLMLTNYSVEAQCCSDRTETPGGNRSHE